MFNYFVRLGLVFFFFLKGILFSMWYFKIQSAQCMWDKNPLCIQDFGDGLSF